MKHSLYIILFSFMLLLTSCFGKTENSPEPSPTSPQSATSVVVTPEEQMRAATEYKRAQSLSELNTENIGTMMKKVDGKVQLYDRRLFINYLKAANITSTESLLKSFQKIEDFSKKEGIELTTADILVTLVGFDQESHNYDMCSDFRKYTGESGKDTKAFKELIGFCGTK